MKCQCCGQLLPKTLGSQVNGNAVVYIPLVDGTEWGVSQEFAAELEKCYPAVDVAQTLREIRAWGITNPKLRKTKRGIMRHINGWFAREQNRGP